MSEIWTDVLERRTPSPAALCVVCNENPPFASLRRCKLCLQATAEAERIAREKVRARSELRGSLFPGITAATEVKFCKTCAQPKSIEEFDRDAVAADGRRRSCRSCIETGACAPAVKSPEARRKDREQALQPHRRAANLAAVKRWQGNNRGAHRAARAVRLALEAGTLAKPRRCQIVGCEYAGEKLHAHHSDYAFPLLVVWCCPSHHREMHLGREVALHPGLPPALTAIPETLVRVTDPEPTTSDNADCRTLEAPNVLGAGEIVSAE
jgi:hypothetical protein